MKETHLGRLLALPHRARSPTAPSAPKPDHALGRPHHRRARGFSMPSRGTPRGPVPRPAVNPPAYAHGPWARAAPSPLLRRGHVPVGCAYARPPGLFWIIDFRPDRRLIDRFVSSMRSVVWQALPAQRWHRCPPGSRALCLVRPPSTLLLPATDRSVNLPLADGVRQARYALRREARRTAPGRCTRSG